jgi:hypothetical protein
LTAPYDFQRWLKSLEGRSSAEMFSEGIRACGEAIINLSSDHTTDRAQFAKRVAEFLSWLRAKGTVKPESVPAEVLGRSSTLTALLHENDRGAIRSTDAPVQSATTLVLFSPAFKISSTARRRSPASSDA